MAIKNLRDGLKSSEFIAERLSGNFLDIGRSAQMSEMTFLVQSGTYTSAGAATVYNTFAAAFSAQPVVVINPQQAVGASPAFVPSTTISAGSFAASGLVAHTGTYIAFGTQTSIST